MPEQQQVPSSFIPHDAGKIAHARGARNGGLLELMLLVSLVLFTASAALGAGVFLYYQYLQTSSTSKVDQLERASAAFEPALIQELSRLDDRMRVAGELLARHLAPSAFFSTLEQTTLQTVSFRSLAFDSADPQRITIRMEGIADSVNSIAHQADLFSKVGMINNPIFSNIDRRLDGVHFTLSAVLNPAALNYTSLLRGVTPAVLQGSLEGANMQSSSPIVEEVPVSPFEGIGGGVVPQEGAVQ